MVGYRGSYIIGRVIQGDAKFHKVAWITITICRKISLVKAVFGETVNESRDPDRPMDKHISRYRTTLLTGPYAASGAILLLAGPHC